MVSSKKILCVVCNKKCSGSVLRFQDQYYHKQCFEADQSQNEGANDTSYPDQPVASGGNANGNWSSRQHYSSASSSTTTKVKNVNHSDANLSESRSNSHRASPVSRSSNSQANNGSISELLGDTRNQTSTYTTTTTTTNLDNQNIDNNQRSSTMDGRRAQEQQMSSSSTRSATLPHSVSSPANGFLPPTSRRLTNCAGCGDKILDGQALIALDLQWHVWCFKCTECQVALHGEYVAKDGKAYCEKDYQKLFGVVCVYCKRYITGKVLQAGEAHHFHPSCARCSKCGDPFVPGEEMYLQGEVTWHPRCGPGPDGVLPEDTIVDSSNRSQLRVPRADSPSLSSRSRSRSASPFSYMSRQYGRSSPNYADSEAVGDLSRIYTISYLNADPTQGYLRRPLEPYPPKSPQFSRPTSSVRDSSRASSRSYGTYGRDRSVPRGMYSVLSGMRGSGGGSSQRARSPSMMNEEAIQMAQYPSGQKPDPNAVPSIERDDFPAPPFPYVRGATLKGSGDSAAAGGQLEQTGEAGEVKQQRVAQQRASRPRSREVVIDDDDSTSGDDPRFKKEEEELSKIASGIGKIFLQTLKEREKLRAWKRSNLDPRNASRTPSATRELPNRMRYDNPTNASPSRDMDRPRVWDGSEERTDLAGSGDQSPTRTRSSLGKPSKMSSSNYGYKVVQANRTTPRPGYGLTGGPPYESSQTINGVQSATNHHHHGGNYLPTSSDLSFNQHQRLTQNRSNDLLNDARINVQQASDLGKVYHHKRGGGHGSTSSSLVNAHLRRSMPNVAIHQDGPPKLYPYHLLATSNYRLPPDVDRCHLERHLGNEEFHFIFHCDRLDFYRLPEWKRNELKRRARLF